MFGKKKEDVNLYSTCDDVLTYVQRIMIAETLQKRTLKEFHIGNLGTARMKTLMYGYVYWPKMDKEVENLGKRQQRMCSSSEIAY